MSLQNMQFSCQLRTQGGAKGAFYVGGVLPGTVAT